MYIRKYEPGFGSHIPVLTKLMAHCDGPVLELGMGIFSTPILHMLCEDSGRELHSYEDHKPWYDAHQSFKTALHSVFLTDWSDIPIESRKWGIVFIDHAAHRRSPDAIRAANNAEYVVLHDTNEHDSHYHYSVAYPHFKYRSDYTKMTPHTTVLSNFNPL